jgi:hypothetical protein
MLKAIGRLTFKLGLGGSPKDAITNLGGYLFPAAGLIETLIKVGWLPSSFEGVVLVLPAIGALLIGIPGGKDQSLNAPVKLDKAPS